MKKAPRVRVLRSTAIMLGTLHGFQSRTFDQSDRRQAQIKISPRDCAGDILGTFSLHETSSIVRCDSIYTTLPSPLSADLFHPSLRVGLSP